jgi:F0F1-type ATP synthase assembly protein I
MQLLRMRAIRVVLGWQGAAAAVLGVIAWVSTGAHQALSAALGVAVGMAAAIVFALVASLGGRASPEIALLAVLRAEAVKVALIVASLVLVLKLYKDVSVIWFIGSFLASVLILSLAVLVREE